ncbi:MAG: DUF5658 family protein [Candidatus Bathyarchaeota archaeon]|nr:DUF5658 family protein [Candidatus Bathyarchaeota archaeon]
MFHPKTAALPILVLLVMGTLDCVTTVIGTVYFGAYELNPFLVGIVGNVPVFMVVKLGATVGIAGSYLLARKIISQTQDKTTRSFRYSSLGIKAVYAGLLGFLIVVVVNNLIVLFT